MEWKYVLVSVGFFLSTAMKMHIFDIHTHARAHKRLWKWEKNDVRKQKKQNLCERKKTSEWCVACMDKYIKWQGKYCTFLSYVINERCKIVKYVFLNKCFSRHFVVLFFIVYNVVIKLCVGSFIILFVYFPFIFLYFFILLFYRFAFAFAFSLSLYIGNQFPVCFNLFFCMKNYKRSKKDTKTHHILKGLMLRDVKSCIRWKHIFSRRSCSRDESKSLFSVSVCIVPFLILFFFFFLHFNFAI